MEIIVCVKRVPMTQEVDLEINPPENDVRRTCLPMSLTSGTTTHY